MKKLMLFAAAAATMLFSACTSDAPIAPAEDDALVSVSFAADLQEALATRGVNGDTDGTQASTLTVAVYNASGAEIAAIRQVKASAFDATLKTTVTFQLVKGQTYSFAFWAQNPSATADAVVFDPSTGKVTVDYTKIKANDESLDAFFAHVNDLTVTGPIAQDVTLKRPFAQLNYGATPADVKAAHLAGIDITQSKVVVNNVYSTLNLLTGEVEGAPTTADITLAAANIPAGQNQFAVQVDDASPATTKDYGQLTVNSVDYAYIGMNYLLVDHSSRSLIKADLEVFDANGSINQIAFSNVPVERNYRTNIIGNLLTSQVEFTIKIDPIYTDDIDQPLPVVTLVTPANFASIDFKQDNMTYKFVGDFSDKTFYTVAGDKNLTQIYDGSEVSSANSSFLLNLPADADNYVSNAQGKDREGEITVQNFNGKQLTVVTYNTTLNVLDNTLEHLDVRAANVTLNISGNTVDGQSVQHTPLFPAGANNYCVYLYMADYTLSFTNNSLTNAYGHNIGLYGRSNESGWNVANTNSIVEFSGNTFDIVPETNNRVALKIWNDNLWTCPATQVTEADLNAETQALVDLIYNSSNTYVKSNSDSYTAWALELQEADFLKIVGGALTR